MPHCASATDQMMHRNDREASRRVAYSFVPVLPRTSTVQRIHRDRKAATGMACSVVQVLPSTPIIARLQIIVTRATALIPYPVVQVLPCCPSADVLLECIRWLAHGRVIVKELKSFTHIFPITAEGAMHTSRAKRQQALHGACTTVSSRAKCHVHITCDMPTRTSWLAHGCVIVKELNRLTNISQ